MGRVASLINTEHWRSPFRNMRSAPHLEEMLEKTSWPAQHQQTGRSELTVLNRQAELRR